MPQVRYQMVMPQWLKDAAEREAKKKGISLAEYIKDLIKRDIEQKNRPTPSPKGRGFGRRIG